MEVSDTELHVSARPAPKYAIIYIVFSHSAPNEARRVDLKNECAECTMRSGSAGRRSRRVLPEPSIMSLVCAAAIGQK